MKIAVLLSAGVHPVSRKPALPRLEAQAIALALSLSADVLGLHAGPDVQGVSAALGHGLAVLRHLAVPAGCDVLPSLLAALRDDAPDLVLAGRRAQGGDESGMLPYLLAEALGFEILADIVAIEGHAGGVRIEQALPRGVRRRIAAGMPLVATLHPAAPPARAYAFAEERRGRIATVPGIALGPAATGLEERLARPRPKLISGAATTGSAAERLKAATQMGKAGGDVLVRPEPAEAARRILEHLRSIGVLDR